MIPNIEINQDLVINQLISFIVIWGLKLAYYLFFFLKYLHFSVFGLNFVKLYMNQLQCKRLNISILHFFQYFK